MEKIYILGGGDSSEREVSLNTSKTIKNALQGAGIIAEIIDPADFESWVELLEFFGKSEHEIIFMGLHGASGEDGRVQSMLELSGLSYTGSDSHASSLAMDKNTALALAKECGIAVAPHIAIRQDEFTTAEDILKITGLPLVVKPNSSGSSVGISIVDDKENLADCLAGAWSEDELVLCEKYIGGRELTVTILGEQALPVVEIKPHNGWYDYANKYTHGKTDYICPAELSEIESHQVQGFAKAIFKKLGCSVYSRIDFRYDGENFYFLEVNTLPGMTSLSLTPMAAKAYGLELPELLLKIIEISKKERGKNYAGHTI